MAITIKDLQPREVWKHFEALTQVPRPSGHLEKIQQFLLDFGKSINVKTWQDEAGNIIMRKPATPGLENRKGIILQAHMDMVPQKTPDSKHDFINDPITTIVKGDWLYADDTTLGADNGLGVAAIMAIMEDESLQHGPLEALITADEETGMYGAFGLKGGELEGELLLNLDSEEEGVLYIGCAGGLDITATMEFMEEASDEEDVAVKVQLKGLRGGHSGLEINAGRGNANKLMARFVREAMDECGVVLASWNGGNMRNAIPASCEVVLTLPAEGVEELKSIAAKYAEPAPRRRSNDSSGARQGFSFGEEKARRMSGGWPVPAGEGEAATAFLGHCHCLTQTVQHGYRVGRTIGIPTVNLIVPHNILTPALGVYITRVYLPDGRDFAGVTNVGTRPTVSDSDVVSVETFLLDFDGDLYDQTIRVEFCRRIRGEKKFGSLEELRDEIQRNAAQTREYFREN